MSERRPRNVAAPRDTTRVPDTIVPAQRPAPATDSETAARPAGEAVAPTGATGTATPGRLVTRSAWSVWAVAFAVGVAIFEWQQVVPLVSLHTVSGILACFVLLQPSAVWRTMLLCAMLTAEFVALLPNPYSAGLLMHLSACGIAVWFGARLLRTRTLLQDRADVFERITPFLRVGFLLWWFGNAVAKLNSGFFATLGSCAPELLDDIPLFHTPESFDGPMAVTRLVLEFGIPTLLLFRRTRSAGVVLAVGWYVLIAAGGNPSHSANMLSFLLLFVPATALVSAGARMRVVGRHLGREPLRRLARSRWAALVLTGTWLTALTVAKMLPFTLSVRLSRWSAIAITVLWLGLWTYLLLRQHRQWLTGGDRSTTLRIREGVLGGAMALMVLNVLCPYLGLKTDSSFNQYANLRTEAGYWNHLVIPEAVRIFHTQDHLVRLVHAQGPRALVKLVDENAGFRFVLTDARRLLERYPYAVLDYELDGVPHHTGKIKDDPMIGGGVGPLTELVGRYRRVPPTPSCQW